MACCCWTTLFLLLVIWKLFRYLTPRVCKISKKSLQGRAVMITGCDTGFGRMISLQLAKKGLKVFSGCLTQEGKDSLTKEDSSGNVNAFLLNVTDMNSVEEGKKFVESKLGPDGALWAIINNAGVMRLQFAEITTLQDWHLQFDVNVFGVVHVLRNFTPLVRKAKGRIINVASVAGHHAPKTMGSYAATKFAIEGLSDALRREMQIFGVKVVIIEPAPMKTKLFEADTACTVDKQFSGLTPEQQQIYTREVLQETYDTRQAAYGLAGDPQWVVDAMDLAVTSMFPPPRMPVGLDYWLWNWQQWMPEWVSDNMESVIMALAKRVLPQPEKAGKKA